SSSMAAAISGATLWAVSSCICFCWAAFFLARGTTAFARTVRGADFTLEVFVVFVAFGRLFDAALVVDFFRAAEESPEEEARALLLVVVLLLPAVRLPAGTFVPPDAADRFALPCG